MSDEKTAMIEILSSILSRLVNVALCLVLTSIALLMLRDRTDLHLGVVALLALVIGILGTIAVRWVLRLLHRLWRRIFDSFAR
ncbi:MULTISPECIES: hypothetical protein [Brevibacterium]|uniref:Uncharacterized protein n=2 Tax=Brevibacterium casei TaxID=33889 RepID=A0A165E7Y6_9MICO|nr:hypothetical protein [Brevibacterium casei]NJE67946.1 hypothetical protein [Brevibacterium sp. LS14]KZE20845.1 hypothetical protein AVW13_10080 [Brevibacterium casei]MCT1552134.1 hypothetical protein [Brevibacterium casei]MCT1560753.1 hypothetical protein [Brevibacterium casei]MCT2209847.1 hypothetical protein [Brevibacterium casei]